MVTRCFRGRPRPRFTAGLAGLVSSYRTSKVGRGTSKVGRGTSKVGRGASSSSSLAGASSLSSLVLRVFLNQK